VFVTFHWRGGLEASMSVDESRSQLWPPPYRLAEDLSHGTDPLRRVGRGR
jgi:hypothetical protein